MIVISALAPEGGKRESITNEISRIGITTLV